MDLRGAEALNGRSMVAPSGAAGDPAGLAADPARYPRPAIRSFPASIGGSGRVQGRHVVSPSTELQTRSGPPRVIYAAPRAESPADSVGTPPRPMTRW